MKGRAFLFQTLKYSNIKSLSCAQFKFNHSQGMKAKYFLYSGLLLLTAGILTKSLSEADTLGRILIYTGIALKLLFLFMKMRYSDYRPGIELLSLALGLALFLSGLYLSDDIGLNNPLWLIIPGIMLKLLFIVLLFRKTQAQKTKDT